MCEREEWWRAYKERGEEEARDRLILAYASLVKYVASRVAGGLPPSVDFDDLVSYGILGLLDALEKFDPGRGVKFETYALPRIRGSIIDGLRHVDWVPRSVRQRARQLEEVLASLENRLGRAARDEEVAEALGLSLDDYHRLLQEVHGVTLFSLDELWGGGGTGERLALGQMIEDPAGGEPGEPVEQEEVRRILAEAVDALPERERLVIALYYYEGLTLKEIGQVLSVSESRVSQLHAKAVLRLRARLGQLRESLV